MTQTRLIFQASGPAAAKAVSTEMARLEEIYFRTRKRKLSPDILSFSDLGTKERPLFGITAYYEPAQAEDVRFLAEQVGGPS